MKVFMLIMLYHLAQIADGLIGIVTFTFVKTKLTLKVAIIVARIKHTK